MARFSIPFLGLCLGVSSWRHISTAFKRKLCRFAEDLSEDDEQDTVVEALKAGHNRSTENRIYGRSPDALAGAPEDLLALFLQASTNWQLSHEFKQLAESGRFGSNFQGTNSPAAAAAVTAPPQCLVNALVPAVETMIISAFMYADYDRKTTARFGMENRCLKVPMSLPVAKLGRIGSVGATYQMKLSDVNDLGSDPSNFERRETDVIAMLRTGGGKYMLAIIPAIMDANKAVIVVLPLKSSTTDWERKLKAMSVPFQVYNQAVPLLKDVNLILISAGKAKFKTWRQHLAELNQVLSVSRTIFDEAHLRPLCENFREAMQYMQEIRQFSMQLALLTGTLPQ
ncbi:uncharacterized protein F5147DRAFT_658677 [Suillus discolor]|uniref:Helicase ATP-binding domain-containing protein n=1 Tax=Suillus discolor TaxID=1912936 RepID=A0A9P7ETZ1_9AGAM|nr:uncharacterized protein F5147DRAFT_658677 [Suillus discolor]KAG2088559.1 hypothetical protein F5147DRAFT_658677 [Suillus discolor]